MAAQFSRARAFMHSELQLFSADVCDLTERLSRLRSGQASARAGQRVVLLKKTDQLVSFHACLDLVVPRLTPNDVHQIRQINH